MTLVYRVRNWAATFETAQSRKCSSLSWVAVPNKHDGRSYRRLVRLPDGPTLYGAWIAILAVASKCPVRGTLADDDGPLTADDIGLKTDFPTEVVRRALEVLSTPEIGWLDIDHGGPFPVDSRSAPTPLPAGSQSAPTSLPVCSHSAPDTEQNRTEQHKTKNRSEPSPTTAERLFPELADADAAPGNHPDPGPTTEPAETPVLTVMEFPVVGRQGPTWRLTADKVAEYRETYPVLDVVTELRKARQWCLDNPAKRKTVRGIAAFLGRWLDKAHDEGRSRLVPSREPPPRPNATAEDQPPPVFTGDLRDAGAVLTWFRRQARQFGLLAELRDEVHALAIATRVAGQPDAATAFVALLRTRAPGPDGVPWSSITSAERDAARERHRRALGAGPAVVTRGSDLPPSQRRKGGPDAE